ncbi:MAG: hypothetical protein PHE25_02710 [Candidatus Gracilibacteria bacterium]|nr:hypothetical protein [Candidatus Gracilibacteria bacterium]
MNKGIIIILLISALSGGVIGYYSKINVKPISKQLDLKSGSTNIDWIISSKSYCDTKLGSCQNKTSSSSSSSWGGGGSSGGGGGK